MKILQLCKKFPYPLKDGESIAVTALSRSLKESGCELSLLTMNTTKHFYSEGDIPHALNHYKELRAVKVDNRIRLGDAFLNLFSKESYHISRFVSAAFGDALKKMLQANDYEIIQLETLYLAPYIPLIRRHSDAVVVMRAHNVEHEIWERIAANTRFWPKRWYLKHLATKLKRYEIGQLQAIDMLVPISHRDQEKFESLGSGKPSIVTPIGLNPLEYEPDYDSFHKELSIGFIGSLDWMPNQEGLQWFLDRVWGKMNQRFPQLKLHIAGRNTPEWLFRTRLRNVVVHGEVPDARKFINQHSLMLVPLLSGSGMRAKILEGMALGKVVLTTTLGLEGIPARQGQHVLVADTPEQFMSVMELYTQNEKKLEFFGRKARAFVTQHYESRQVARRLLEAYASLTVEAI